jgi:hypothetical protein
MSAVLFDVSLHILINIVSLFVSSVPSYTLSLIINLLIYIYIENGVVKFSFVNLYVSLP